MKGKEKMNTATNIAALAVAVSSVCLAKDTPTNSTDKATIPPVIIEASRLDKTVYDMPLHVETVSRAKIASNGSRDVIDALSKETGVFVHHLGGNNPALTQVSMRGYGENAMGRVKVVVDGECLNNPDMSTPDFSRIPLGAIERIEVLHGPQTVLHGDNASAGLINIVTETPDYTKSTTIEVHGGSWNTIGASASLRGGSESALLAWWANGSWDHSDGYRHNSGFDLWRINGGLRKDFENGSNLKLSAFWTDTQYELPSALNKYTWKHRPKSADPAYRRYDYRATTYGLNFSGKGFINENNVIKFASTASLRSDKFNAVNSAWGYTQSSPFDTYSYSFTPQYINTSRFSSLRNELTTGLDLRYYRRLGYNHYIYTLSRSKQKEDQSRFTVAGFARDELFLTDEFSVFAGARLARSMFRSEAMQRPSRNDNLCAFEAGANYRPVETAKIFAKWSRFYRLPFADEISYIAPSSAINPERGWSMDIGGDWRFLEEFSVGAAAYISETSKELYYDPVTFKNDNLNGTVRREGVDFNLAWEREKTAGVRLRYGFVRPEICDGTFRRNDMPSVPRHQASLDGRVYVWDEFFIRAQYRYTGPMYSISDFNNAFGRIPGFGIFSIGFQYEPEIKFLEGFVLSFDIDNLFDKNYCDYSTYGSNFYPGAGRSYMFKISFTF